MASDILRLEFMNYLQARIESKHKLSMIHPECESSDLYCNELFFLSLNITKFLHFLEHDADKYIANFPSRVSRALAIPRLKLASKINQRSQGN